MIALPALTVQRAAALARFLLDLPPEQWDYEQAVAKHAEGCGTVCCAAGWLPRVDPVAWCWNLYVLETLYPVLKVTLGTPEVTHSLSSDLQTYFEGLDYDTVWAIFFDAERHYADAQGDLEMGEIRPYHVARLLLCAVHGGIPLDYAIDPAEKACRDACATLLDGLAAPAAP